MHAKGCLGSEMNWLVHPWPPTHLFTFPSLLPYPFFLPPFSFPFPIIVLVLPWHAFSQWSDVPVPCIGDNNPGLVTWFQLRCWFRLVSGETLTRLQ